MAKTVQLYKVVENTKMFLFSNQVFLEIVHPNDNNKRHTHIEPKWVELVI